LNLNLTIGKKELEDFHNTDVEVPAKLIVDGNI
jgi:hypothetical protein